MVSNTPRPHFTPGKDPVPILHGAGWPPGPVWTGGKSRPHRDSIPDRPVRSQSPYRLSYPAHTTTNTSIISTASTATTICTTTSTETTITTTKTTINTTTIAAAATTTTNTTFTTTATSSKTTITATMTTIIIINTTTTASTTTTTTVIHTATYTVKGVLLNMEYFQFKIFDLMEVIPLCLYEHK